MRRDTAGSEGISALLIFIVLVLVASSISALIIVTGEKLMQASQSDAQDMQDGVYGKIFIIDMIVIAITYDANNDPTLADFRIIFELTPGSPDIADVDALWSVMCPNPLGGSAVRLVDIGDFGAATNASGDGNDAAAIDTLETGVTYMLQIRLTDAACAPVYQESHTLVFGFIDGGGVSTWSLDYGLALRVGDRMI